jgi:preprotein translocase subunit YajC
VEAFAGYLPILLLLVFAYLLIVRPARKRTQETAALQAALSKGDSIMLTSGIFGRVDEIVADDDAGAAGKVKVELAPGVVVTVHRGAIGKIIIDDSPTIPDSSDGHGAYLPGAGDMPDDRDAADSAAGDDDRDGTTGDPRIDRGDASRGAL